MGDEGRGQPLRAAPRRRTAHGSPENLEFFVWDDATQAEPPRCTYRAVPRFVIRWRAVKGRGGIAHDGLPPH